MQGNVSAKESNRSDQRRKTKLGILIWLLLFSVPNNWNCKVCELFPHYPDQRNLPETTGARGDVFGLIISQGSAISLFALHAWVDYVCRGSV